MQQLRAFFRTDNSWANFIIRLVVAVVFIPHGAQKLLGLFGGYGFSATMGAFTSMGMPALIAFLVIMAESLGAVALLVGFITRFAAFGLTLVMLGAIFMAHASNGFFMNWAGTQKGEGFEYHVLVLGITSVLTVFGAGRYSVDGLISRWLEARQARRQSDPSALGRAPVAS